MDRRGGLIVMDRKSGLAGFVLGLALSVTVAGLLVGLGGFLSFVDLVSRTPGAAVSAEGAKAADAIVVLTGGPARLETGMKLLNDDQGKRLLISGVNPIIDREEVRKLIDPAHLTEFDCCVDLDKSAANTIGNATETARWAADHNYRRIIVVTAGYHMPRSLAEMKHAAPGIAWIPQAVHPADTHLRDWWRQPGSARLLFSEYVKYLAMQIRFRLETH